MIAVGTDTIELASSLADAQAGIAIPITSAGATGIDHAFTVAGRHHGAAVHHAVDRRRQYGTHHQFRYCGWSDDRRGDRLFGGGGNARFGLQDGQNYYVIVVGPDTISCVQRSECGPRRSASRSPRTMQPARSISSSLAASALYSPAPDTRSGLRPPSAPGRATASSQKNTVVLEQISSTTTVYLGAGSGDAADIEISTPGACLAVNGDIGGDTDSSSNRSGTSRRPCSKAVPAATSST